MPYITPQRKEAFAGFRQHLKDTRLDTAGELNYGLTLLMDLYLTQHGESYRIMNEIIGAAECAKAEFMRRRLNPYEDLKRVENGDVFAPPIRGHE